MVGSRLVLYKNFPKNTNSRTFTYIQNYNLQERTQESVIVKIFPDGTDAVSPAMVPNQAKRPTKIKSPLEMRVQALVGFAVYPQGQISNSHTGGQEFFSLGGSQGQVSLHVGPCMWEHQSTSFGDLRVAASQQHCFQGLVVPNIPGTCFDHSRASDSHILVLANFKDALISRSYLCQTPYLTRVTERSQCKNAAKD